ncbi:MAG: type 4a pilus biogenesis protein PilO [Thermodesulfobacteriota bacterium]
MATTMDDIYKLPTSKKVAILIVLICVVIGLGAYTLVIPGWNELSASKNELNNKMRELNESKAIAKDLEKFKKQVEQLNLELTNALTQLPNEKEIPEILKNISTLGKESKLNFTLFRPKPEEPQQFYAKVPIELIFLGNYHNTGIFFDKVSKLPRIINVVNFNMVRAKDQDKEKGKSGDTEFSVRTSCLVNTYRFIEKSPEQIKSQKKKDEEKKIGKKKGSDEEVEAVPKAPKK